jgi:hypothetical protein
MEIPNSSSDGQGISGGPWVGPTVEDTLAKSEALRL